MKKLEVSIGTRVGDVNIYVIGSNAREVVNAYDVVMEAVLPVLTYNSNTDTVERAKHHSLTKEEEKAIVKKARKNS